MLVSANYGSWRIARLIASPLSTRKGELRMTMLVNPGQAREARKAAIASLDKFWGPSPNHSYARGAVIGQDEARRIVWRMTGGVHYELDWATQDAILADLVGGGLLIRSVLEEPGRGSEYGYRRPEVDPPVDQPPPKPEPTMWHPFDGSEPRPWADVWREEQEAANRQAAGPDHGSTFDE